MYLLSNLFMFAYFSFRINFKIEEISEEGIILDLELPKIKLFIPVQITDQRLKDLSTALASLLTTVIKA